jgi:hypothetical protein
MQIELKNIKTEILKDYIKKLLSMNKFIFLTLNDKKISSSVFLPQRDAVKLANLKSTDIFDLNGNESKLEEGIKIAFFNGSKVVDALNFFNKDVSCKIKYDKFGDDLMATDLILFNSKINIKLYCADPSLSFIEMNTDSIKRAFGTPNTLFEFELLTIHVDEMKKLFSLNKEDEFFWLYSNKEHVGVLAHDSSYDSQISKTFKSTEDECKVLIKKKYIDLLDKENYYIKICENKVVLKSLDSETLITIAVSITEDDE